MRRIRPIMRMLGIATIMGGVVVSGVVLCPLGAVAVENCRGESATIVGTPGEDLLGTQGPDVVVTNGASSVRTRDGADVICVTGRTPRVDAGAGDDLVDSKARIGRGSAELGEGDDRFVGGPSHDTVTAGEAGLIMGTHDTGTDVIRTGRGGATVLSGFNTNEVLPDNADRIILGDTTNAANRVTFGGKQAVGGVLTYGKGPAALWFATSSTGPIAWGVDARTGEITADEAAVLAWTGNVTKFQVSIFNGTDDRPKVTVQGTAADEFFRVDAFRRLVLNALTGGGDDTIQASCRELRKGSVLAGGRGRDVVDLGKGCNEADIDLARHRLSEATNVTGVEDLKVAGRGMRVHGDAGGNLLRVAGCRNSVSGGRGDDMIKTTIRNLTFADCHGAQVNGGRGADQLTGSLNDDTLLGGRGPDTADGRAGTDTCVAEVTTNCERT